MTTVLYAGSFDPITNGHLDIIETASKLFDKVVIAVAYNPEKESFIPVKTRLELIKKSVEKFKNVEVDTYLGLTVEYAKQKNIENLLRGIRSVSDVEYELKLAQTNHELYNKVNTVFLSSKLENSIISSSMIREIVLNKGDISKFVPKCVNEYIKKSFN